MSKKMATKKPKVAQTGKYTLVKMVVKRSIKVIHPKAKPEPKGTSEIEFILEKPIGVSKKFCLLDVPALHRASMTMAITLLKLLSNEPLSYYRLTTLAMTCRLISARPCHLKE
jgi:hypothetical protein